MYFSIRRPTFPNMRGRARLRKWLSTSPPITYSWKQYVLQETHSHFRMDWACTYTVELATSRYAQGPFHKREVLYWRSPYQYQTTSRSAMPAIYVLGRAWPNANGGTVRMRQRLDLQSYNTCTIERGSGFTRAVFHVIGRIHDNCCARTCHTFSSRHQGNRNSSREPMISMKAVLAQGIRTYHRYEKEPPKNFSDRSKYRIKLKQTSSFIHHAFKTMEIADRSHVSKIDELTPVTI